MIDPEKKLWQNVLITAIKDAFSVIKEKDSLYKKQVVIEAKNWLLSNNHNYFIVCSMADVNPLSLREKVKNAYMFRNQDTEHNSCNMIGKNTLDVDLDE